MSDIPVPEHLQKHSSKNASSRPAALGEVTPTVGSFFAEHRGAIDARKVHLSRIGMGPVEEPAADIPRAEGIVALPTQRSVLAMPTGVEAPILDVTHAALVPTEPPTEFEPTKLPKLLGVNTHEQE